MVWFPKYQLFFKFDRSILKRNWKAINESPLKKAGLLARHIERGLIRKDVSKKQRPAKPGRPPKSRAPGHPFRMIFSDVNLFETNVVIGHFGFYGGQTAMEINEFGQRVVKKIRVMPRRRNRIRDPLLRKKVRDMFKQGKIRSRPLPPPIKRTIKYPERPFAKPTTERVAKRLPKLWEGAVGKITVRN